jgi:DNA-binding transcriptional ArsR family regulator
MELIDRIRQDIQDRLDTILGEADKLRKALGALDPRGSSGSAGRATGPVTRSTRPSPAPRRGPSRSAQSGRRTRRRTPPGATKRRVIEALSDGTPKTAGEVATATGLARGTVSTTLSKLARSGELVKADRGYALPPSAGGSAAGGGSPSAGGPPSRAES